MEAVLPSGERGGVWTLVRLRGSRLSLTRVYMLAAISWNQVWGRGFGKLVRWRRSRQSMTSV